MKKTRIKSGKRINIFQVFKRLKTGQKILYVLWPLVLIILLTQNFFASQKLGDYQIDSITHDITLHMQAEFEKYLLPVETLINGLATNVESRMDNGAGAAEIENYLVEQTELMTGEFSKDSTGLYGYINGTYIDGAHWVPPDDYDPEKRDWYIETLAAGKRVAYVSPYIDMMTGDSSVTVSKLLKDGKNVIALDLKVDSLQRIVDRMMSESIADAHKEEDFEDSIGQTKGKYVMILDKSGKIVVHTDRAFGGQNIREIAIEPFTSIAKNILDENKSIFRIKYDGTTDSLTVISLNDDWYAVSAVDYDDTFGRVIRNTIYTAVISVVVIVLLTIALFNAASYAMKAEDDRRNTGALSGIYAAVYKIHPKEDIYERIQGTSKKVNSVVPQAGNNAQEYFYDSLKITTNGENMDKLREFVDMSTLDVRLKDCKSITMEYINTQNKWCRERFVVAERDDDGSIDTVLWVVEEIDAEKRSREELIKYSNELEEAWEKAEEARFEAENANKAKSDFLANMSHEIRTPINTVLGLDTMILRESGDEQIRKYALNIQNAGQSLLSIINDILDLSKIESGKMDIVPVDYDVASLINDVSNMIMPKADTKGLEFELKIDPGIPSRLFGDDVRIRQILINLLTNAVKYTNTGTVTLAINAENREDETMLTCSVTDTGIGIAKEDLNKLFEAFVRIEEKRNRNIEGTGLGINIVSNLLNLMDSHLEVESEYGKGSEFRFAISQKVIDTEPIGDLEKRIRDRAVEYSYETGFIIPDVNLLVVDDNEMNRYVFRSLLKDMECNIDEADRGYKCLELVKDKKYDIIFMDHMMPEMDGIETFHKLREMKDSPNVDTPVIILTANAITGAKEMYLSEGFDDFLTKPIVPEKLEKLIDELIPAERKKPVHRKADNPKAENPSSDELPAVEGVDWDYALLKLKKTEILKGVIKDFRLMANPEMKALKDMYDKVLTNDDNDGYNDYRIKVHAMKNSAAMCGALQVSSLARVLEFAARDLDKDTMIAVMPVFEREWQKLKKLLDDAFASEAEKGTASEGSAGDVGEADKVIDRGLFAQYLETLGGAMEELDTDTADAIMEELAGYRFEPEEQEIIEQLMVAVKNLDIDASAELIAKLR
jgi:signal transduction histidine kinase/CheY-like chemotaxis protein